MRQIDLGLTKPQARRALPVLVKGRQLLVKKGWCQGVEWEGKDGSRDRFCAAGAVNEAGGGSMRLTSKFARTALNAMVAEDFPFVEDYNDVRGRTKRQVLGLFTRTIKQVKMTIKGGN